MKTNAWKAIGLTGVFAVALVAKGEIIYNNSTTDTGNYLTATASDWARMGDQIILANTSARWLTNFSIEYYSPNASFAGSVQADIAFYLNNGTPFNGYPTPGTTPFFDTGFFSLQTPFQAIGTNAATLNFNLLPSYPGLPPGLFLPTNFTFVVTFIGLSGTDQVGVELFNPPTVGQNYPDYWYNGGSGWQLLTNTFPVNFGAKFEGTVPEPTVLSLGIIGAATWLAAKRRRR